MKTNLLNGIKEGMKSFSKGQRLISAYILENYDKAAYMTAAKLGAVVGVSESTVVRFAIELGFEGYPEFQHALQEIVINNLTSFQRIEVTNNLIGDADVLTKVLASDCDKIRHTAEQIDRGAFYGAVNEICAARNIYIVGARSSSMLAGFLAHSLRMMFDNVKLVEASSGSEMFEQLFNIGEQDAIVAISFPRYSKRIINAVNYAKHRRAKVIAITDSISSPIASPADRKLLARSDMASFVDSLVAPLSIINALVVALSRARSEELTQRLHKLEEIWDEFDVYDKNQG